MSDNNNIKINNSKNIEINTTINNFIINKKITIVLDSTFNKQILETLLKYIKSNLD